MHSRSAAERLGDLSIEQRDAAISLLTDSEAAALMYDWRGFLARPDQIAPPGDWDVWLALAGRGWGKTRVAMEWVREEVAAGRAKRIALVAETSADARDVLVEGESGLLNCYPPGEGPTYEPSKRRLTWPNGAVATLYNATEPDQLRGPQHDLAVCDELAKWKRARDTWDMLQFGLRLGTHPRVLVATTPRPIEIVKEIVAGNEGEVVVTRGRTMDNASNLSSRFLNRVKTRYAGTRLGRQELDGEILGDIPGALWTYGQIEASRVREVPEGMSRVLVAVDPAVTANEDSDEHGIVAVGQVGNEGVVLEDGSAQGTPLQWARRALALHDSWDADGIVVEVNQGGDMVAQTIRSVRRDVKIIEVRATRGKHVRAEPIAALYEQGRVHHVGAFPDLEQQMTLMTPEGYVGEGSPDRLDALVWGLTELFPSIVREPKKRRSVAPPAVSMPMARR